MESCIRSDVVLRWIWQRVCMKFCVHLGKGVIETTAIFRQAFMDHSLNHARAFEWKSKLTKTEKWWDRWICSGRPNSQFCIPLWLHEMYKVFTLNTDYKRTGCCITIVYSLTLPFLPGNVWPKTAWLLTSTHSTCLPFWDSWSAQGRITGSAEHPHRTLLPGCI
jgi:hypothetical protein